MKWREMKRMVVKRTMKMMKQEGLKIKRCEDVDRWAEGYSLLVDVGIRQRCDLLSWPMAVIVKMVLPRNVVHADIPWLWGDLLMVRGSGERKEGKIKPKDFLRYAKPAKPARPAL